MPSWVFNWTYTVCCCCCCASTNFNSRVSLVLDHTRGNYRIFEEANNNKNKLYYMCIVGSHSKLNAYLHTSIDVWIHFEYRMYIIFICGKRVFDFGSICAEVSGSRSVYLLNAAHFKIYNRKRQCPLCAISFSFPSLSLPRSHTRAHSLASHVFG